MAAAVISLAVIVNPRSHANRRTAQRDKHAHPRVLSVRPENRQELTATLQQCADRGIRTLAIDGGDGTVRDVLSVLPDVYGAGGLPDVVILPSGHANVIAADVGTPGRDEGALGRVVAALDGHAPALRAVERPLLEVRQRSGIDHTPGHILRGLFFGAATFTHATQRIHGSRRFDHVIGAPNVAMYTIASALRALLPGKHRSQWLAGEPMTVVVDRQELPQAPRHFLVLATTLHRLVLGLWPFWGESGGSVRWLDIDAPPRHLLRAAPRVLRGRPQPWMTAAGYRSGTANHLTIDLATPFVLDGEVFEAGPAGVDLSVGPTVRFLAP